VNPEAVAIAGIVCVSALTAWVLWLRHARAMLLTVPQEAELRRIIADLDGATANRLAAVRASVDNLAERIQHIDNRTKR
jgi:hypothetical protein